MIVNRLPYELKLKWHDVTDKITEKEEREITIEDMDGFITSKACAATHAIFGNVAMDNLEPPRGFKFKNKTPPRCLTLPLTRSNSRKPALQLMVITKNSLSIMPDIGCPSGTSSRRS